MDQHQADCDRARLWDKKSTLSSVNLQGCDLSHADLERATLLNLKAQGAIFRYAVLAGANLTNADLRDCDLSHANLDGCILDRAQMGGANLLETSFQGARLNNVGLSEATPWQTNFHQARLNAADLHQVHIHGCDLSEASLWRTNLQGAFIKDTSFAGANLSEVQGQSCDFFENVDMAGAILWGSNFQGAKGVIEREIPRARLTDYCTLPNGSQMGHTPRDGVITLRKGALLKPTAQQRHIQMLTQVVWVTASRGFDRMLEAGEYLDFSEESDVLISAVAGDDVTFLLW